MLYLNKEVIWRAIMNHVLFIIIEVVLVYLVLSYIAKKRNEKYIRTPVLIGIVIVLTLLPIERM